MRGMRMRRILPRSWGLMLAACCAVAGQGAGIAANAPDWAIGAAANWWATGGSADESGFSQLDQVNDGTIARLGLAWSLDLPGEVTLEATPLAVDGILYFTGSYSAVYAVDGVSGRLLWKYDPEIWAHEPERMRLNFAANRGAAYADGRVFAATLDGRLIALDAKTGKLLWSSATLDPGSLQFSTGAPRVMGDKVIIGNGGADFGSRGFVTAYDAATGRKLWRFHTVPGSPDQNKGDAAMERAAASWSGEYWKTGTGGSVWNGMTYDPELNRIYIGTGNSGPYDPSVRSPGDGDNLYLVSIVALDASTGKYLWHYQMNPREAWDYKAAANIIAATLTIDGQPRKVLMQQPTNGFYYVLDRLTGKLISAEKTGKVTWADHIDLATGRPVERPNIRYENGETEIFPSPVGTHNWQAMSYSPQTGLAYIPHMQAGSRYTKRTPRPGDVSFGGLAIGWVQQDPDDGTAALLAWDPVRQQPAWKVKLPTFWNGGTLATSGQLVFQGTADGWLSAYHARTGARLWRFNAGHGILAAPVSWSRNGRQYISVLAGYGGAASMGGKLMNLGWTYGAQPRRLLTFTLAGKAVLPPTAPPERTVAVLDDPALTLDPAVVEAGRTRFLACALCHGRDAVSGGAAPDLRASAAALDFETLWAVTHDGALIRNGMPRFETMSRDELRQIWTYIRARARDSLQGKADVGGGPGA